MANKSTPISIFRILSDLIKSDNIITIDELDALEEACKLFNIDGICRKEKIGPNQRVCPIGKVLCADLSCRDSYDDCYVTDKKNPLLQRCIGQQIVTSATLCPSTITCSSESEVVCPTGECVSNEIYCPALNKCNNDYPYLCQNNVCAKDYDSCPPSISCGENKLLCSDNICREKC